MGSTTPSTANHGNPWRNDKTSESHWQLGQWSTALRAMNVRTVLSYTLLLKILLFDRKQKAFCKRSCRNALLSFNRFRYYSTAGQGTWLSTFKQHPVRTQQLPVVHTKASLLVKTKIKQLILCVWMLDAQSHIHSVSSCFTPPSGHTFQHHLNSAMRRSSFIQQAFHSWEVSLPTGISPMQTDRHFTYEAARGSKPLHGSSFISTPWQLILRCYA